MTPFPTGDDRYFLSQFHSGTAFLAFPALPDGLLFCSNLYSCSCKRIRSSLLLKSIWSSSILSISPLSVEVKLETSPTAHGKGNLKIRLGYY